MAGDIALVVKCFYLWGIYFLYSYWVIIFLKKLSFTYIYFNYILFLFISTYVTNVLVKELKHFLVTKVF